LREQLSEFIVDGQKAIRDQKWVVLFVWSHVYDPLLLLDCLPPVPTKLCTRLTCRYNFKTYKACFQGRDLVAFIVSQQWQGIATPDSAVRYGQRLLDGGVIHHVVDKHAFEVCFLFLTDSYFS
jgi:hypothetical protein